MLPAETCLLTFHMGKEVVSEGGVGAGVTVGGAEAAGAQTGQPVHTRRQKLCAARSQGQGQGKQKRRTEINTGAGKASSLQGDKIRVLTGSQEEGNRLRNAPADVRPRGEDLQVGAVALRTNGIGEKERSPGPCLGG